MKEQLTKEQKETLERWKKKREWLRGYCEAVQRMRNRNES